MAVVVVDERGRLTVPSELHVRDEGGVDLCRVLPDNRPHSKPALGRFSELAPHKTQQ